MHSKYLAMLDIKYISTNISLSLGAFTMSGIEWTVARGVIQ
jgi:hypothetical protein